MYWNKCIKHTSRHGGSNNQVLKQIISIGEDQINKQRNK